MHPHRCQLELQVRGPDQIFANGYNFKCEALAKSYGILISLSHRRFSNFFLQNQRPCHYSFYKDDNFSVFSIFQCRRHDAAIVHCSAARPDTSACYHHIVRQLLFYRQTFCEIVSRFLGNENLLKLPQEAIRNQKLILKNDCNFLIC